MKYWRALSFSVHSGHLPRITLSVSELVLVLLYRNRRSPSFVADHEHEHDYEKERFLQYFNRLPGRELMNSNRADPLIPRRQSGPSKFRRAKPIS